MINLNHFLSRKVRLAIFATSCLSVATLASGASVTPVDASATTPVVATVATTPAVAPAPVATPAPKAPAIPAHVQKLIDNNPNLITRISAMSKQCVTGKPCANAGKALAPASATGEPRKGEDIYNGVCSSCHAAGLMNAPKFGNKGDWSARIGKGIPTLYGSATNGFNAMPARGGNTSLSDQEVKNAVDYMIAKSR